MKKTIIIFAALAALSACSEEGLNIPNYDASESIIHAYASGADETKSMLSTDGITVLWEDRDEIKIGVMPKNYYQGKQEEVTAIYTTTLVNASSTAYFKGTNPYNSTYHAQDAILLFPSSTEYTYNLSKVENIKFNLPKDQEVKENGSFGSNYNLASAKVNAYELNKSPQRVDFLNACAVIRIILPEGATDIQSITISSNSAPLAGKANLYKTSDNNSFRLVVNNFEESSNTVTLTNNGQAFISGIEYNAVVWPGTHSSGLTFTFTNSAGSTCEKSIDESIVLEASKFDKFNFKSSIQFPEVYRVVEEVQKAEDLLDGETYIIAWNNNQNNCLSNNNGNLILKSYESTPTNNKYSEDDVFVFNKKTSTLNGADKYNSKSAATFMSVSTGLYIDSSLHINATAENALEFVVANLWSGNVGSRMDVWRNQSGDKLYLYYGTSVGTAKAEIAEAHYHQEGRKWNFYKVERK